MSATKQKLISETKKWLEKAKSKRNDIKNKSKYIENIDAYISDTNHFLENKEYVKAFEAVIWAWAWMEILEELGYVGSE